MAYASVASLTRTIELLLTSNSPMEYLIRDHREEFLALHEKISSLEVFLKNFEKGNDSWETTDFEAQIKEVANVVEHIIQLRVTETIKADGRMQKRRAHRRLCDSLQQVTEDIDRVQKESTNFQFKGKQALNKSLVQDSSSAKAILNVKKNMVGRDDQRKRLLEDLTRGFSGEPQVIPIIGMGGIGKTTLAKEVFNDVTIGSRFDVRAWATVSSQYNVKEILLSLLHSTKGGVHYMDDEAELADMLQKSLKGRRYLIVLDDMWSSKAWDDVRQCFPSQDNGSRILLTTRNTEVACYAGTENLSLQMCFMNPDESWNLFKSAAFASEALPSEFETIGKQIVDKCQGLPLIIIVVAGLLSKSKRTIEDWENVAKDVKSFVTNDPNEQCLNVLGLSYNQLTSNLKRCLLYFGTFPEDSEISVKRLVRLWMAEGFLKLEKDLQGEAEKCLQELIDRCLVLVSRKSFDETKIRSCKVHDLIYELCLREAQRENAFVMNDIVIGDSDIEKAKSHDIVFDAEPYPVAPECHHLSGHKIRPSMRWTGDQISYFGYSFYRALLTPEHRPLTKRQTDDVNNSLLKRACSVIHRHLIRRQTDGVDNNLLKRTRSIIFFNVSLMRCTLGSELIHFSLLRILDLRAVCLRSFPPEILTLIWLRYLVLSSRGEYFGIPPEICNLWNLQTFIVEHDGFRRESFKRIWQLVQLRHLILHSFYLPNPPKVSVFEDRYLEFSNIHTISGLSPSCCTKEVLSGIRNVKKLEIYGDENDYERFQVSRLFENLVHLHQVETLSFEVSHWVSDEKSVTIPSAKLFPATLKKLKLYKTCLRWEDLNIIGELPNLEVLKLTCNAAEGQEWHPIVGGFTRLKLLLIDNNDLKYWKATDDNFPVLERLVIRECTELEEMPIEFADIHSLQLIELKDCTPELEASAARIQQEQEDFGNKPADVRILKSYSNDYAGGGGSDEEDYEDFYCRVNKRYGFDSAAAATDKNDHGEDFNSRPNKIYAFKDDSDDDSDEEDYEDFDSRLNKRDDDTDDDTDDHDYDFIGKMVLVVLVVMVVIPIIMIMMNSSFK